MKKIEIAIKNQRKEIFHQCRRLVQRDPQHGQKISLHMSYPLVKQHLMRTTNCNDLQLICRLGNTLFQLFMNGRSKFMVYVGTNIYGEIALFETNIKICF